MASKNKNLAELLDANGDVLLSNLDNVNTNLVADTTPQLGGDLDGNGNTIDLSSSTDALGLPTGTTAQRPGSPSTGYTRMNTTTGSLEFYDGTSWLTTNLIPTVDSVSGTIYAGITTDLTLSLSNATDNVSVLFKESGSTIATVSDVSVSSGSATVTVPSAVYGQTAGDTITVHVTNQDGTPSSNSQSKTVIAPPSGGTITNSGGYRIHTFTSSSNFVVNSSLTGVDYLLVAGGGGGAFGVAAGEAILLCDLLS